MNIYKTAICSVFAAATIANAVDALGGSGQFEETGSLSGWTTSIYSTTLNKSAYYGSIKVNINDDDQYVAEFWSNGRSGLEDWDIQLKKTFTLETGYAYTIQTGFYSYDEDGVIGRSVSMGVLDSDFETYFAESFDNLSGDYEKFEGTTYEHCGPTDKKAIFFINGGTQVGGFAVPWVVIDKQKINCGSGSTNTVAVDALGGSGQFEETGSLSGWTTSIYSTSLNKSAYYGSIKINMNDDDQYVAEFWSNGRSGLEDWDIQLKRTFTLETGYAYTIQTGFYSYDEDGSAGRSVSMGVLDSDFETYFAESFDNLSGDYSEFVGTTYKHCGATDKKAIFFINGGTQVGGFAIPWVVIDKQKINCGSSTPKSSASTPKSSASTTKSSASAAKSSASSQLTGNGRGPVSQYGQLQTGTNSAGQGRIYGSCPTWSEASGKPVKVRGMSLFWSIDESATPFYNETAVDALVNDMKIEVIRIAMGTGSDDWGGSSGYAESPTTQENYIKTIVNAAIKNDIYVIIDWHSHTAHTEDALAKSFFSKMAKLYGSYDNVIFEIYNEPAKDDAEPTNGGSETGSLISWSTVRSYAMKIIPVIREYSDNLIIVGTPSWSADVSAAAKSPITGYDNIAYTFHFYASSHTVSGSGSQGDNVVSAIKSGLPVFVTEWGTCEYTGNGKINSSANTSWQKWLNTYDLSAANWSASIKDESCAAFSTLNQGYGALAGISGMYYTESGNLVKGYITKNVPSSYKACKVTTTPLSSRKSVVSMSVSNKHLYITSNVTASVQVFDVMGNVVLKAFKPANASDVSLENVTSGNYIIRIKSKNGLQTLKASLK